MCVFVYMCVKKWQDTLHMYMYNYKNVHNIMISSSEIQYIVHVYTKSTIYVNMYIHVYTQYYDKYKLQTPYTHVSRPVPVPRWSR